MRNRGFDLEGRLEDRRDRDLYRDMQPADAVGPRARFAPEPGTDLPVVDGEESLVFAANDYLGLAGDDRLAEAASQAAEVVGTGAGASRLVTGDTLAHRDLEARLADAKDAERALVFSSGYAANVGTITALDPDVIFSDELNHASVIDGCRLSDAEVVVYEHCDPDDLARRMRERAAGSDAASDTEGSTGPERDVIHTTNGGADQRTAEGFDPPSLGETYEESWLVVTDSVFSMDGTVAPLADLADVSEDFGAWLMVDEAHATGLYEDGGGIVQREGLEERVQVQLGTLSKALGSQGGYVAGSESLIELLVNEARSFVYSTGLTPPAAAAASEALHLARTGDLRDRLWANVEKLRSGLEDVGYDVGGDSQILPVHVGDRSDALALDEALRERGIVAPAIRPPTVPEGTSRIRVVPSGAHTAAEIERCIDAFCAAGDETGVL